jgi:hypothetical protein
MPKAASRWATRTPILPRPTMPTVFSNSSTPENLLRFHSPFFSDWSAAVDDHHAGLGGGLHVDVVQADAGAGDDLQLLRGGERLGVDLGGRPDQDGVDVGDGRDQLGAVGAVGVPDLEVGAERLDGGRGEFFGDQDDGSGCDTD